MMEEEFEKLLEIANANDKFDTGDPHIPSCTQAISGIIGAFYWPKSAEGGDFWQYVSARLRHISETYREGDDD